MYCKDISVVNTLFLTYISIVVTIDDVLFDEIPEWANNEI